MLTAYFLTNGKLRREPVAEAGRLGREALWLDLVDPDEAERRWVEEAYGQRLPSAESVIEIEATSRFYQDETGLHVHTYFLDEQVRPLQNLTVALILNQGRLFTLRDKELGSFQEFTQQAARTQGLAADALGVALRLFEIEIDRLADLLERMQKELNAVGARVFGAAEKDMETVLTRLATGQDINDKARLSLMDQRRALSFLLRGRSGSEEHTVLLQEMLKDIESLTDHSTFLFEKTEFLMEALLGRISIEQNKIIKIFSIAAVVFLPPTLIASIYGMNFHFMPELSWPLGYPLAIALMIAAGIAPYWIFKRRGWL